MDITGIIQSKLIGGEKCKASVLGHVDGEKEVLQAIALVKGQQEYALFFFKCANDHPREASEFSFSSALPVSETFKFAVAKKSITKAGLGVIALKVTSENLCVIIEVTENPQTQALLSELQKACQAQLQNAGSGLPSTFSWIDKYRNNARAVRENPFLNDTYDPLKTNIDDWALTMLAQQELGQECPTVTDDTGSQLPLQSMSRSLASSQNSLMSSMNSMDGISTAATSTAGFDPDIAGGSRAAKMKSRDNLIKLIMASKKEEYTEKKFIHVFCGTWNTNGQAASEPCHPWLSPPEDDNPPDIYAIGFQELDLSKNAYIFTESTKEEEWYKRVEVSLHPGASYKKVRLIRLVGMMLIVFAKEGLKVKNVMAAQVGTGLMGMMGNKGGVAVRLDVNDTSLCFVNTHLAAHTEEYERRNQDYRDISSRMAFIGRGGTSPITISEHEVVFWLGDLNYRLSDIDNDNVKKLIGRNQLEKIMQYDQLHNQRQKKRVFVDYEEAPILFPPTYKYDPGTDQWDTSEKCRTPAWCDRVLWRGSGVTALRYRSHMPMRVSDHKPVSALFNTKVRVINQGLYRRVYEDTMKQLDRMENDFLPQVALKKTEVRFEAVKFIEPQTETLTVKNTGQVPVQFEFINKLHDTHYCKPWLSIEPCKAVIQVGGECTLRFEVYVNRQTAPQLNSMDDRIEDIVVMHLEGGKDLFITVNGTYLPSCFGSSIDALVHMFGPIREVPTEALIDMEHGHNDSTADDQPFGVPKEVWRLVDHLYQHGLEEEDLFLQPGLHSEIQQIRDALDTGTPHTLPGSIHSVAEALLIFLESLMEPVIPYAYFDKCLDACAYPLQCKQIVLSEIPSSHSKLFLYVCSFLRKCLLYAHKNNLDGKDLARLFGGLLLRAPPKHVKKPNQANLQAAFVFNFLSSNLHS